MAPLEYTLTITVPCGSSTKPVDCRYSGSSLTNAPVSAATARASALCPSGKVRPCLAVNSVVDFSSSTQSAATRVPAWVRESPARWKAVEYERMENVSAQLGVLAPVFVQDPHVKLVVDGHDPEDALGGPSGLALL